MKQLNHDEAMGKEVIQGTTLDIQKKQSSLEKMMRLWAEAKEKLTENESDQYLKRDEHMKRKDTENQTENIRNMTNILKEEESKLEDLKKKSGETQEQIDKLQEKKKGIKLELDNKLQENKDHEDRQSQIAEEKRRLEIERQKKLQAEEIQRAEDERKHRENRKTLPFENHFSCQVVFTKKFTFE